MRYNPLLHGHPSAWDDERRYHKGKGADTPSTPNYSKLAQEQAVLDRQAAERNVLANRAIQNTPWGTINWSQNKNPVTVDQSGFDAMSNNWNTYNAAKPTRAAGETKAAYNARVNSWKTGRNTAADALRGGGYSTGGGSTGSTGMIRNAQTGMMLPASVNNYGLTNGVGSSSSSSGKLRAPTIEDFTSGGDNTGQWTQDITLNPDDQARLTAQQQSQRALAEGAQGMLGRVNDAYSKEFNWADAPDVRQVDLGALPDVWNADWTSATGENGGMAIDKVKEAIMSRIAPDLLRNRQREEAQMIAQGVGRGANEAWNKSQTTLGRNETDAAMQALLQGVGEYGNIRDDQLGWRQNVYGEQNDQYNRDILDRDRYFKEQKAQRDLPMDEYMRLMGASGEVQMPNFPGYAQQGGTNAANMVGAAQDTYNSKMQAANAQNQASSNFWNTAASLGGTLGSAYLLSDPRLKTDVKFLGMHPLGIGIYSWVYRWGQKAVGVMADELLMVKPEAVGVWNGYLTVDYGRI